ncbi:MAG: hypothetical protein M1530_01595 [Candidatus Marsarchaeota archaeon]|nr:hypothetical protein [Candidatus Marsarchaeota archaeon]
MYMIRPFPGRINSTGEKEYGGFYCWFASPNEKFTRDYGGGKISFSNYGRSESEEEEERKRKRSGSRAVDYTEHVSDSHAPPPAPAPVQDGKSAAHEPSVLSLLSEPIPSREHRRVA